MNAQFKKGVLELIVLLIISKEDEYGYSLVKKISYKIIISEGTIYPILRRLVKENYLTTYNKESSEGPFRKYYKITEEGFDRLHNLRIEWKEFVQIINCFVEESNVIEQR
ncbi:PadR family transcriptional regulator [Priestia aryabhattai]|uniref:PadR family transcriptional regulator n=1 Tax=Priestia aryabhattai TaxID=412384 RepID=UPI00064FEA80|nr:PadR family transcriptional regulator [Priestia aryabhattai]UPK52826.1 PadR family transcriptional regulator [Bacillus sp. H8-1]KML31380.1 PadR family transcriptional regulator [Priestia aryabhattai]KMN91411.1 PadR family transcriptional regulator [Priestia aryabhattai]MDC7767135.1 PadR family transcriptional regulator [Priestia aryabhattai]WKG33424.1 PadR family transcriptional regulator [Priestia aryabhattai]